LRTTRSQILLKELSNFASIFSSILEFEKSEGGQFSLLRDLDIPNPHQRALEEQAMKKSSMKFVFHEQEVADIMFRAMVEAGRVVLHMVNSSRREASVDLIGAAFALPCLRYSEKGWQRRGMPSGPPGWAVCHDTAREPQMFLGHLHSDDVRLLRHEFGLHSLESFGRQVAFKDSIAGQTLTQIMLHDPIRAALFRKADASLDNWAEQVISEEQARPCRQAI
jgi:hypothetical protein